MRKMGCRLPPSHPLPYAFNHKFGGAIQVINVGRRIREIMPLDAVNAG
ncbi:hypothetical protein NC651_015684 [Populus alba x Populus x berolinensis]|nr:hypothetical protein NC651_015682 [Populus alba x Populus x berolinensis]KAJ6913249.1 hypothetical protein NC651_015684 [Populus alba x Populus x berolinensis]